MAIMEIQFDKAGPILVVTLKGRLDAAQQNSIRDTVGKEIESTGLKALVFDLSGLDYVSSAGLRSILQALKKTKSSGGVLRLCSIQPTVMKLLELSGFLSLVSTYPDRDSALKG